MDHGFWKPIRLTRDGPKLSHLCFADDLILFTEVSIDQVNVISQCLDALVVARGSELIQRRLESFSQKMCIMRRGRRLVKHLVFQGPTILGSISGCLCSIK